MIGNRRNIVKEVKSIESDPIDSVIQRGNNRDVIFVSDDDYKFYQIPRINRLMD